MKLRRKMFVLGVTLLVGIFTISQVSYASRFVDDLRPKRASESGAKAWAEGFLSSAGVKFAHDEILKDRMQMAFNTGQAVNIFGHQAVPEALLRTLTGKVAEAISVEEGGANLLTKVRTFLIRALQDDNFLASVRTQISRIDEDKVERAVAKEDVEKEALEFLRLVKSAEDITQLRKILIDETRFTLFVFGEKGIDPYLYSIGDIASDTHRGIDAHAGRFEYEGSSKIKGGPRSIYLTLARIEGFMNEGTRGRETFRAMMVHEFEDLARGRHSAVNDFESDQSIPDQVAPFAKEISRINGKINEEYRAEVVKVVKGEHKGALTADTDRVSIEKYQMTTDLGTKGIFAIKGSSKAHPDVPKGSRKINLLCVKADVGSIGGHGTVPNEMLEAVADYWARAAEEGKILDFFVTRCGDDISVTVTHINGKDNEMMHKLAWDAFINATAVAKDMGLYGAGQDLLADSFSGNIKGAGPGITELEFTERPSEPIIIFQGDKSGPGVFNEAIRWTYSDPNSAYVSLKPDKAGKVKFGVIDFEYNNHVGREAVLDPQQMKGMEFHQAMSYVAGEQTRYSFTNLTLDGEDIAGVTATRLHNIAGEYTGKDDPILAVRTQKDLPAEGILTAPFFGLYETIGWMMGSQKGYLLPCALPDAKIGVYDGPPLMTAFGFNINNGRLVGFMDLFAANPAIRAVQDMVGAETSKLLRSTDFWKQGKGRAPSAELAYQKGLDKTDKVIPWAELKPEEPVETAHLEPMAKFVDVARRLSGYLTMQQDIIEALINIGPAYKLVDGRVIKNPVVLAYLEELGVSGRFSDAEGLRHEAVEATLAEAYEKGVFTYELFYEWASSLRFTKDILNLIEVYDRNWGHVQPFREDPNYAIRHVIAEFRDGGDIPSEIIGIARTLSEFAEHRLEEANIEWKEFSEEDVEVLASGSEEVKATRQRIAKAEKVIGIAREEVAKQIARAKDLSILTGIIPDEAMEGLKLEALSIVRERIDNVSTMIARSDPFYSNVTSEDISSEKLKGLAILIPARDVIENLAGFKEECFKLGSLPIYIQTYDDKEDSQISILKETGFLPKNIESTFMGVDEEERYIVLGFRESLKDYRLEELSEYQLVQQIEFAPLKETEILSWERVFASLAVAVSGRLFGIEETSLDEEIMAKLIRSEDISDLQVGIPVTEQVLRYARDAYEELKKNI